MAAATLKTCPTCGRTYDDPGLTFCLEDGVRLQEGDSVAASTSSIVETSPHMAAVQPNLTNPNFPAPVNPLEEGAQVGEYVVGKKIGEGGMGMIFSGVHPVIGKKVALKVLNLEMASNPEIVQRFILEAKAVNQIGHRNIVDIFSFGRLADGRHYFAMEFLAGQSLAQRLASEVAVPWDTAIQVWIQIASAIEAAHETGIIHRDLKPDNVYITPSGEGPYVKVLDFGIAKLLGDTPGLSKTSTGVPIGTPAYMSPEQATGTKVDSRTDLYAFGIIMFETIAGRPPFWHHNSFVALLTAHLNEAPPPLSDYADVHPDLNALVERLLAKDPANRPQTMADVRQELVRMRDMALGDRMPLYAPKGQLGELSAKAAEAAKTMVRPAARGGPTAPAPKSKAGLYAGVAAAVVALGGGAAFVVTSSQPPPAPAVIEAPRPRPVAAPAPTPAAPSDEGEVNVLVNVAGARVYLDKNEKEKSESPISSGGMQQQFSVKAGVEWWLRIEADGYTPIGMPVKVNPGKVTSLPFTLVAVGAARPVDASRGGHGSKGAKGDKGGGTTGTPIPGKDPGKPVNPNLMGFD